MKIYQAVGLRGASLRGAFFVAGVCVGCVLLLLGVSFLGFLFCPSVAFAVAALFSLLSPAEVCFAWLEAAVFLTDRALEESCFCFGAVFGADSCGAAALGLGAAFDWDVPLDLEVLFESDGLAGVAFAFDAFDLVLRVFSARVSGLLFSFAVDWGLGASFCVDAVFGFGACRGS